MIMMDLCECLAIGQKPRASNDEAIVVLAKAVWKWIKDSSSFGLRVLEHLQNKSQYA